MRRLLLVAVVAAASLLGLIAPAGAQAPTGQVTIIHGVRGLVADVYVDGQLVLQTFQPERTTQPLPVPAGPHVVEVRVSGAPAGSPPTLTWNVDVQPGAHISAVVHLTADGKPTVTRFDDDVSRVSPGASRVVVRHAAAAPPIDVRLGQQVLASGLPNANQAQGQVPPAAYTVQVTQAGTATPLAASQDVTLAEGTAMFLYLIGSQAESSIGWIAQRVDDLQTPPVAIQTGDSGLAATNRSGSATWPFVIFPLVALAGAVTLGLQRRRRGPAATA